MPGKNAKQALSSLLFLGFIPLFFFLQLNADPIAIPFRSYDHLIVVKGSINGIPDLNFIIDTGASNTMINRHLSKRLRLKTSTVDVVSWGERIQVRCGKLEEIRIGETTFTDIETRVGDLEISRDVRVDALIGLDLLKRTGVLIDYEHRVISFESHRDFEQQAVFYPNLPYLPIRLKIQDKLFTLILDTGSPFMILFEEEVMKKIDVTLTAEREQIGHVGGNVKLRKVLIKETSLAETALETITAFLMDVSSSLYGGADGIFSPASLKLKRLQINFETKRISWEI
jgi:hypothetical protein